jgi:hypothetical protein
MSHSLMRVDAEFQRILKEKSKKLDIPMTNLTKIIAINLQNSGEDLTIRRKKRKDFKFPQLEDDGGLMLFK